MVYRTNADLFEAGDFISHAGNKLAWKIECDAIRPEWWDGLARMIMDYQITPFRWVEGIPRGGIPLASALQKYADPNADNIGLVVDDVWTTGTSMKEYISENHPTLLHNQIHRWVVFARSPCDDGTRALFTMPERYNAR